MKFDYHICKDGIQEANVQMSNFLRSCIYTLAKEQLPQYLSEMPFLRGKATELYIDDEKLIFIAKHNLHMSATFLDKFDDEELKEKASRTLAQKRLPSYTDLYIEYGEDYFSENQFLYITPIENGAISSEHFDAVLVDWLNEKVLPLILENNKRRVLDAIPEAPQYDIEKISRNIFVLDDESDDIEKLGSQGTCFYLKDVGFVTCDHVLTSNMECYHPKRSLERYPIEVMARDALLDLAVLRIDDLVRDYELDGLEIGSADNLQQMDHIAVAGFPNYRIGDTGVLSPGLVIGFRPTHGIRRLLVNAAIVSGNSGGPVLNTNNQVIGIAVTGADCTENIGSTENHGVIPIDALTYLQ